MRTRRRTTTFIPAGALLTALLLAGCTTGQPDGDGGEPSAGESTPAPIASAPSATGTPDADGDPTDTPDDETPAPAASATEVATGPPFSANTRPDTAEPTGEGETFLSVTDVRTATHEDYDRVVFDLDGTGGGQPGWRVEYVDRATDDGSGHTVDVDGDAILRVSISGTATPTDSGVEEFARDRIEPEGAESVDEIVYRYWFEGYTTAFLGIDEGERPFRVFLLENPTRVVLDVQH